MQRASPEHEHDSPADIDRRKPLARWLIPVAVGSALLGALIGGLIGAATYEQDPDCYTLCFNRSYSVMGGAVFGALIGAIAGPAFWGLSRWLARRP